MNYNSTEKNMLHLNIQNAKTGVQMKQAALVHILTDPYLLHIAQSHPVEIDSDHGDTCA